MSFLWWFFKKKMEIWSVLSIKKSIQPLYKMRKIFFLVLTSPIKELREALLWGLLVQFGCRCSWFIKQFMEKKNLYKEPKQNQKSSVTHGVHVIFAMLCHFHLMLMLWFMFVAHIFWCSGIYRVIWSQIPRFGLSLLLDCRIAYCLNILFLSNCSLSKKTLTIKIRLILNFMLLSFHSFPLFYFFLLLSSFAYVFVHFWSYYLCYGIPF